MQSNFRRSVLGTVALATLFWLPAALAEGPGPESAPQSVETMGVQVHLDPVTGRLRAPSPEQRRELAARLREILRESVARSPQAASRVLADGSVAMSLDDRHRHFALARFDSSGLEHHACISGSSAAAAFLAGIAPGEED